MIYKVEMYAAKCDNCGKEWMNDNYCWSAMNDESGLKSQLDDDDWHTEWSKMEEDKHYCPACYEIDDDDKLVIKKLHS